MFFLIYFHEFDCESGEIKTNESLYLYLGDCFSRIECENLDSVEDRYYPQSHILEDLYPMYKIDHICLGIHHLCLAPADRNPIR